MLFCSENSTMYNFWLVKFIKQNEQEIVPYTWLAVNKHGEQETYWPVSSRSVDDLARQVKGLGKPKPKSKFKRYPVRLIQGSGKYHDSIVLHRHERKFIFAVLFFSSRRLPDAE